MEIITSHNKAVRVSSETIIVAGSGRSGTTWLGLRPYFSPDKDYPEWRPFIEKVLSGKIENELIDYDKHRMNASKTPKGILLKQIRANGMLAWIDEIFAAKSSLLCAILMQSYPQG